MPDQDHCNSRRRAHGIGVPAALLALALAGCSKPADTGNATAGNDQANVQAAGDPMVALPSDDAAGNAVEGAGDRFGGATTGGDGSAIILSALTPDDLESVQLAGELGCSFASADRSTLLLAKGDVGSKDAAQGVVKVGDYVERIAAPGGFDAMLKGATFSGQGKQVRIALTGAAIGGGESPPRPATLTYDRADGARRTIAGRWTCGP